MGLTNASSDLLPGTLELLILKALMPGDRHGYGIVEHLRLASDDVLRVGESALYPALQRLLLNGCVKAEWGTSENNRRARYYTLTAAGRQTTDRRARRVRPHGGRDSARAEHDMTASHSMNALFRQYLLRRSRLDDPISLRRSKRTGRIGGMRSSGTVSTRPTRSTRADERWVT